MPDKNQTQSNANDAPHGAAHEDSVQPLKNSTFEEFAQYISFQEAAAHTDQVALYCGLDHNGETLLDCGQLEVVSECPEHSEKIPLGGKMTITFEHWLVYDEPVCNPNLVSYRLMKITALVSDVLEYDKSPPDSIYDMDLNGEFEVLDYQDIDINSGEVPERIVDMHCDYLKDERAQCLYEEYEEAYLLGKLPAWDSRVLNVVKVACKKGGAS